MANKDKLTTAEPATNPVPDVPLTPQNVVTGTDVLAGGAKAMLPEDIAASQALVESAKTETVRTGIDIRTGAPVMKTIAPKKAAAVKWNTGDRAPYVAHTAGTGSLNGRAFDFKAGDTINLNADEAKLFAAYVTKVVK